MKKITIISAMLLSGAVAFMSCGSNREPGRVYMPDMAYSRAVESYSEHDSVFTRDVNAAGGNKIFYNAMSVTGTLKRGELFPYPLAGDSNGYKMSASVKNPFDSISKSQMAEAGRLFNINCAICHGEKGGGNGPIAGNIGAVANLTGGDYVKMADGTMFHSITFGRNNMGSYASQLTRAQRWMIVKYIRTLQPAAAATATTATPAAGAATAKTDTTAKKS
jgi:mono/diheme cytochrome c family protein